MNKCVLAGLVVAGVPFAGFALGIRVPDRDARAAARGNAFAATADNPSAIYYNPAGITQLEGMNSRFGLYGIYLKDEYRAASEFDSEDSFGLLPQMFSTYTPQNSRFSFGFGTYSPYGLSLSWPDDVPYVLAAKSGRVSYISASPVVAYKICEQLSLAVGPTINYSQVSLTQGVRIPGSIPPRPIPGAELRFRGDAFAFGATAGLLWKPHEKHSFGLTYRSGTSMDWDGHSRLNAGTSTYVPSHTTFEFPHTIVGGYSFRPAPKWNLEFNLDWTDWSSVKVITLHQSAPLPNVDLPFNWQSSFMYEFGATRSFDNGWAVSAGYIYSENSVPSLYFSPTVPDSDRHVFSLGVGRTGKRWSWDVAYQIGYGPERTINNPPPASLVNGRYTFFSHALALSVGYHF